MILPGQMPLDHRALQYHEAAEVRQMPSLPFVAEPGSADHFRRIPDLAILSTRICSSVLDGCGSSCF